MDKLDYSKHPYYPKLRSCKASAYIPEWHRLEMEKEKASLAKKTKTDKQNNKADEQETAGRKIEEHKKEDTRGKKTKTKTAEVAEKVDAQKADTQTKDIQTTVTSGTKPPEETDTKEKKSQPEKKEGGNKKNTPQNGGRTGFVATDKDSIMS